MARAAARAPGRGAVRWLPVLTLWAAVAIPMGVLVLLSTADLNWLGRPTASGWAVVGLGVVAPLLWLAALVSLVRARQRTRAASASSSAPASLPAVDWLLAALLLAWLGAHGWLGMRIWH